MSYYYCYTTRPPNCWNSSEIGRSKIAGKHLFDFFSPPIGNNFSYMCHISQNSINFSPYGCFVCQWFVFPTKLTSDLSNISRLCGNLKNVTNNLPTSHRLPTSKWMTTDLSNIGRLWWKFSAPPKTDQWPANISQVELLTIDLSDVGRFNAIDIFSIAWSPKTPQTCQTSAGCDENPPLTRKPTIDLPTSDRLSYWPSTCMMLAGLIQQEKCGYTWVMAGFHLCLYGRLLGVHSEMSSYCHNLI